MSTHDSLLSRVEALLNDLNLHCTDHVPDADCEGCRVQVEEHVRDLVAEVTRLQDEKAAFYMDYRMKCDEQTKAQAVRIEQLDAALRDVQAHRGAAWLPIETAPTDGTSVIVYSQSPRVWVGEAHYEEWDGWVRANCTGHDDVDVNGGPFTPTHWMSLRGALPAPDAAPGSTETPR